MNLTGTARGRNQQELMTDAHRQAQLFYGNEPFTLNIGTPCADTEYHYYSDGRIVPIRTAFSMEFEATATATIADERP